MESDVVVSLLFLIVDFSIFYFLSVNLLFPSISLLFFGWIGRVGLGETD